MAHRSLGGGGPRGPGNWVCPVCHRGLNLPKVLNCYHMVCQKCLEQHVRVSCKNGLFPCPICKVLIPLPVWGGLDAFATLQPPESNRQEYNHWWYTMLIYKGDNIRCFIVDCIFVKEFHLHLMQGSVIPILDPLDAFASYFYTFTYKSM